jgi:hypothetical protein
MLATFGEHRASDSERGGSSYLLKYLLDEYFGGETNDGIRRVLGEVGVFGFAFP